MNFTIASAIGLIAAFVLSLVHLAVCRPWRFAPAKCRLDVPRYGVIELLVHFGLAAGFLGLMLTSFYPVLTGQPLHGYLLMAHVGLSPVFYFSLLGALIVWGEDCCFSKADCDWVTHRLKDPLGDPAGSPSTGRFDPLQKSLLWMSGVLGFILLVTMLLSMVTLFGTHGQEVLLTIHRWAALVLFMLAIFHGYRTVLGKPGGWTSLITGKVSRGWMERYSPE